MHTETLAPNTQKVFQKLGTLDVIKPFYLSGGTALALYLGHRESEDLDFFSKEDFNPQKLQQDLENSIKLSGVSQDKGTFDCYAESPSLLSGMALLFLPSLTSPVPSLSPSPQGVQKKTSLISILFFKPSP
jgi:hypothetical protein